MAPGAVPGSTAPRARCPDAAAAAPRPRCAWSPPRALATPRLRCHRATVAGYRGGLARALCCLRKRAPRERGFTRDLGSQRDAAMDWAMYWIVMTVRGCSFGRGSGPRGRTRVRSYDLEVHGLGMESTSLFAPRIAGGPRRHVGVRRAAERECPARIRPLRTGVYTQAGPGASAGYTRLLRHWIASTCTRVSAQRATLASAAAPPAACRGAHVCGARRHMLAAMSRSLAARCRSMGRSGRPLRRASSRRAAA
jgi:hypothetical protein